MVLIKLSTAREWDIFAMDATGDGVTGVLDAGWTKRIKKSGGAFAAMTVTVTELENGWYKLTLSTAHTDTLGVLSISMIATGVKRVNLQFLVRTRSLDDLAFPVTSGQSMAVDASGRLLLQPTQTGVTIPTVTTLTNLPAITANWLTAAGIASGALDGKGNWNLGKTGYALSAAGVQAVWDALTSALTVAGSIGKLLVDNINAAISSRFASAGYTAPLDAAGTRSAVGLATANLDTQLAALPWNPAWDAEVESEMADALEAMIADSIPADGSRPSIKQALYLLTQFMMERSVSGTTLTVKKPDGTTTLMTLTLDNAINPTSITRTT